MKFLAVPSQAIDITGQRFGRLTARGPVSRKIYPSGKSHLQWLCACDCGGSATAQASRLRNGHTRSCGCLDREKTAERAVIRNTTHNESYSDEYRTWAGMLSRCQTKVGRVYQDYGARNIRVCERWASSFENFLADVGRRPSPKHSIDRFPDNDGNYEPGNVRWATREQQMRNTRNTLIVSAFGKTQPLAEFVPGGSKWPGYGRARARIYLGWDHERVVTLALMGQ